MGHVKHKKIYLQFGKGVWLATALLIIAVISTAVFVAVEKYGVSDALYAVLCSISWAHCSAAYAWPTKLISLVMAFSTWTVLAVLMESGVESFMKIEFGGNRMRRRIDEMRQHVLVCGYGALGKTVAEALENEGVDYVVIDQDPRISARLKDAGVPCVEGSALDLKVLKEAGADKARLFIAALGTDADNVFLALTAKELNPGVMIATRAFTEGAVAKLHRAGADIIVMPEIIGGLELAREALNLEESHVQKLISRRPGTFNPKKLPPNPKYQQPTQPPK